MKAVLQRVREARVVIAGDTVGAIGQGLLILLCAERGDTESQVDKMLAKILRLRIFPGNTATGLPPTAVLPQGSAGQAEIFVEASASGKMNFSVQDVGGGLLIVSQFTLAADVTGGNRPSFTNAAAPGEGRKLYDYFVAQARSLHARVETGQFAADMQIHLVNDGPVTIPLQM